MKRSLLPLLVTAFTFVLKQAKSTTNTSRIIPLVLLLVPTGLVEPIEHRHDLLKIFGI
jgi:hypothetical protein